jgi:hypothetical protein
MKSVVSHLYHLTLLQYCVIYMKHYFDMITWSDARQRLCKNVSAKTDTHAKIKDIVANGVFYAVRAETLYK